VLGGQDGEVERSLTLDAEVETDLDKVNEEITFFRGKFRESTKLSPSELFNTYPAALNTLMATGTAACVVRLLDDWRCCVCHRL